MIDDDEIRSLLEQSGKRIFHYRLNGQDDNLASLSELTSAVVAPILGNVALQKKEQFERSKGRRATMEECKKLLQEATEASDRHLPGDYVTRLTAQTGMAGFSMSDKGVLRCGQCNWHWVQEKRNPSQAKCPRCKSTQKVLPYSEKNLERGLKRKRVGCVGSLSLLILHLAGGVILGFIGAAILLATTGGGNIGELLWAPGAGAVGGFLVWMERVGIW